MDSGAHRVKLLLIKTKSSKLKQTTSKRVVLLHKAKLLFLHFMIFQSELAIFSKSLHE